MGLREEYLNKIEELEKENQELKGMIFDVWSQACYDGREGRPKYHAGGLTDYQNVQDKLIEWGLLNPEDCAYLNEV